MKNVVNIALFLLFLNPDFCNSQVKVFNIFIRVVTEGKSGFVSHTKLTAEATFMDLFHS